MIWFVVDAFVVDDGVDRNDLFLVTFRPELFEVLEEFARDGVPLRGTGKL